MVKAKCMERLGKCMVKHKRIISKPIRKKIQKKEKKSMRKSNFKAFLPSFPSLG
jgi:hypothetical protein